MAKNAAQAHANEMAKRRKRQLSRRVGFRSTAAGGGTPTGRNPTTGRFSRIRAKWMVEPRADQMHPERHTHPRSKRAA